MRAEGKKTSQGMPSAVCHPQALYMEPIKVLKINSFSSRHQRPGEKCGLTLRRLGPDTLPDFGALLVTPPHGWCWCVAWETPDWEGWEDRSEKDNRCLRKTLWDAGSYHGRIFYLNDRPVAWCRVGPRTAWPKLCATFDLEPVDSVYTFVCFGIAGSHRGQGLMHQAMALALRDLAAEGVVEVEGFPRKRSLTNRLDPGEVWMGPARLFSTAGFEIVKSRDTVLHMRRRMVNGRS